MDNNKNLRKTHEKSNAELRKMYPRDGSDIGIIDGEKVGSHENGSKFTKRSKLSHNN
ncbi:MAG: hypothetical protein GX206_02110 [Clostridiales bacterium]|nr:hypothetical protein [Clostridiales bacterium]